MCVQLIGNILITSDRTHHQARSVGDDQWECSWLPGRKLTVEQSVAAIRVAEEAAPALAGATSTIGGYASELGLTVLEAIGMAASSRCSWPEPPPIPPPHPQGRHGWLR